MRSAVLGCALVLLAAAVAAQRPAPAADLPPVLMICPVHPEVIEDKPGVCPICKRALEPVRLDTAWMCPVHSAVIEDGAGRCRICRRDLIRVTVSLTFACRADGTEHLDPGMCPDGSPRVARRTLRPHGDHNPKHGGQFFMAPDRWHHLEGTYPRDGVFRLYLYDDFSRPLPESEMGQVIARVVTEETFDPATRQTREVRAFPLRLADGGAYLEAQVDAAALPRDLTAKVRLGKDAPEARFDFRFAEISREPVVPAAPAAAAAPARTPAAPPRTATPAASAAPVRSAEPAAAATAPRAAAPEPPSAAPEAAAPEAADPVAARGATVPAPAEPAVPVDERLAILPIPNTMEDMLAQLGTRTKHVGELIEEGNLEAVYVPAFQAKDLAVALEPHLLHLPADRREAAAPALEEIVRLAWLIDAYGDTGNRQQLNEAYASFSSAVAAVLAAFGN